MKTEIQELNFVKTILMLLVVFGHSCAFWSGDWFTRNPVIACNSAKMIYKWLNSFHVYAFALVSGIIFWHRIAVGGYKEYKLFLFTKIKRLVIPYFFVAIIWVIPIDYYFFRDIDRIIQKYILCTGPSQLWFLWMLFWVFLLMWPLNRIITNYPIIGLVMSLVFYYIGTCAYSSIPNYFCIFSAFQYIFFFSMGIRIGIHYTDKRRIPFYVWIIIASIFFYIRVKFEGSGRYSIDVLRFFDFCMHASGAVMIYTLLEFVAEKMTGWKNSKFLILLSRYAMPIYLFHQQIIFFTIYKFNGKISPWINIGINFVVAILGSFIISYLLMKWKITSFLIGEKLSA